MDQQLRELERRARMGDSEALARVLALHLRLGLLQPTDPIWAIRRGWEPTTGPGKRSRQIEHRRRARARRREQAEVAARRLPPIRHERHGRRPSKRRPAGPEPAPESVT